MSLAEDVTRAELVGEVYDFLISQGYHANYPAAERQAEKFIAASLGAVVEAIAQRRVEAFKAAAVAQIEVTANVCISAHGDRCIGGIAYRDAARIVADLPTISAQRTLP